MIVWHGLPGFHIFLSLKAHRHAMEVAGIRDGMNVLEVATGSGEMFRRLVKVNPSGATVGLDLSPNMAARTLRRVRNEFPEARTQCKAVDARHMPFRDETFDALVCCYLLELLSGDDIVLTLMEFRRILRKRGMLTLVLIGQNTKSSTSSTKCVERSRRHSGTPGRGARARTDRVPRFPNPHGSDGRQTFYPSRVLTARK